MQRLKGLRATLSFIVLIGSIYGLATDQDWLFPYVLLFLGALMLVSGLEKIEKEMKNWGYIYIGISIFLTIVSVQGIFFSQ